MKTSSSNIFSISFPPTSPTQILCFICNKAPLHLRLLASPHSCRSLWKPTAMLRYGWCLCWRWPTTRCTAWFELRPWHSRTPADFNFCSSLACFQLRFTFLDIVSTSTPHYHYHSFTRIFSLIHSHNYILTTKFS